MFFQRSSDTFPINHIVKINSSLSCYINKRTLSAKMFFNNFKTIFFGRTALFAFTEKKGSLTVEAALILPFFIFVCMCIMYFSQIFLIHSEIQGSLFQTASYISQYVISTQETVNNEFLNNKGTQSILCMSVSRRCMKLYSGDVLDSCVCLQGGTNGIQFLASSVSDEYVDLIANYRVQLPYGFGLNVSFPIVQRCRIRAWTGLSGTVTVQTEEMVYITDTGSVYHRRADCTHLKLTIRSVDKDELEQARNNNGGRYKACDKCVKGDMQKDIVYITNEGDRYHNNINCSGLKRSVRQISLSQVEGRKACSRCGGVQEE